MLHPSYMELIDRVNETNKELDLPPIESRYTLVMALAKRARRLVEGAPLMVPDEVNGRMLSQAVNEMNAGKLGIIIEQEETPAAEEEPAAEEALSPVEQPAGEGSDDGETDAEEQTGSKPEEE